MVHLGTPTVGASPESRQPDARQASGDKVAGGKSKKKAKPSKLFGAVVAIVVIALFALYVVPLFVPHPLDPNEGKTNNPPSSLSASSSQSSSTSAASSTPSTSSSASSTTSGTASGKMSSSSSDVASSSSGTSATSDASTGSPSTGAVSGSGSASSTEPTTNTSASPGSFSTDEGPTLADFTWLTGEAMKGNVPPGAKRITNFGDLLGGWKGYLFGAGHEWLMNVTVDAGQSGAVAVFDWRYVHDDSTGEGHDDTTPDSTFRGTWEDTSLDATGSGRVTLVAFWQQDGHQYATGSFIWPDGGQCTIALVRP